jgi:uncharacterized protein with HEPN domain
MRPFGSSRSSVKLAKHLSTQLRDSSGSIPWRKIAGMRDKLIHDYMGVDWESVWLTFRTTSGR